MKRYTGSSQRVGNVIIDAMKGKRRYDLKLKQSTGQKPEEKIYDTLTVWVLNNEHHRTDGPAFINLRGVETWSAFGIVHRIGGPAVYHPGMLGAQWWVYGVALGSWEEYQAVTNCSDTDLAVLILKWGTRE